MSSMQEIFEKSRIAARESTTLSTKKKNEALLKMATNLMDCAPQILEANALDLKNAEGALSNGMMDRLRLDFARILAMAKGIREVANLPDPVGKILQKTTLENGLQLIKTTVPLGVIGIIYESRPNVTSDAAALCFKSGNACILRGGKDAFFTSNAIVNVLRGALKSVGVNEDFICMPNDTSRESAMALMTAVGKVDALIPRGGKGLITSCVENAKVPCIQTGTGICHIFVDKSANLQMALEILYNAKTSRPSVCNAAEVCLVHQEILSEFLPMVKKKLNLDRVAQGLAGVQFRADKKCHPLLGGILAQKEDFDTEFLDYILAVKSVKNVQEAIEHVALHSTGHSDCIVSECPQSIEQFINQVDSAAVYVNASTRFTDGGEFGKGCEIGISTQKLHARGPMGLEELTSYKYIIKGQGQVRV